MSILDTAITAAFGEGEATLAADKVKTTKNTDTSNHSALHDEYSKLLDMNRRSPIKKSPVNKKPPLTLEQRERFKALQHIVSHEVRPGHKLHDFMTRHKMHPKHGPALYRENNTLNDRDSAAVELRLVTPLGKKHKVIKVEKIDNYNNPVHKKHTKTFPNTASGYKKAAMHWHNIPL